MATLGRKPRLVVLSGAGVSAESGIKTFRGGDGLWENHRIEDVATPEAWQRDPKTVLRFYNERRQQIAAAHPNAAHIQLAQLEDTFDVTIFTQNIDDLHERAGSTSVFHVHGNIMLSRSSIDDALRYENHGKDIALGDTCELGSQLRPHVVWFGEMIEHFEAAAQVVAKADIFLVIGTSLAVFPIALLVQHVNPLTHAYLVALDADTLPPNFNYVSLPATKAMPLLSAEWRELFCDGA